jgi:nitroreductase
MAITHQKMSMDGFVEYKKGVQFDTGRFIEFLKQRRSHRNFKKKEIPLEALKALVDVCRYAPTGTNTQNIEILVIRDEERIQRLSSLSVDYYEKVIAEVQHKAATCTAAGKQLPEDLAYALETLAWRKDLLNIRDAGFDPILHRAPAVMIFHSPRLTGTPRANCVIAAQTVVLVARTMGLETCHIALFERAANAHPPLIRELSLPSGHRVYSVLIMGYPRFKYPRAIPRKPIKVRWE